MFHIAFCGYMGAGKTTYADDLVKRYGYTRRSFADPLKEQFIALAGRPIDKGKDRKHLQALGTLGREINPLLWVVKALDWFFEYKGDGPFVVDDLRYPNEWAALAAFVGHTEAPFYLVHVTADEETIIQRLTARDGRFDPAWLADPGEQHHLTMKHDATIPGVGDVASNVDALMETLKNVQSAG